MISPEKASSLELAVAAAVQFAHDKVGEIENFDNVGAELFASVADQPDNAMTNHFADPWQEYENEVMVDSPEALAYALHVIAQQINGFLPQDYIVEAAQHEAEHATAMAKLGLTAIKFGVGITVEKGAQSDIY